MWRVRHQHDRDRGGISVIVAILMVSLLGFAALAVDVGTLYAERAQLQNASDAAALMVAQKCAKNQTDPNCSATSPLATELANKNAVDGLSNIKSIALDTPNRTVKVTTGAQETGKAPNTVSLFFARALGFSSTEVTATSSVGWGSPVAGTAPFPLVFSICQVSGMVGGAAQLLQNHDPSANGKGNPGCTFAGQPVPGGFSWITQQAGTCGGSIDLSVNTSGSETGNNAPSDCDKTLEIWVASLTAGRDVTVLLPVYQSVTGSGTTASYHLISFAAFRIKGWKLDSGGSDDKAARIFRNTKDDVGNALACIGSCRGIIGSFVQYVSLADGYRLGPVDPYGATVVRFNS